MGRGHLVLLYHLWEVAHQILDPWIFNKRCSDASHYHGHMAVHIGRETVFNPLKTIRYFVIFRISRTQGTLWQWQTPHLILYG